MMITDDLDLAATAIVAAGREAGACSSVEDATTALMELAESLLTAGDACDALAAHVVPDAIAGSICDPAIRLAGRRCDGAVRAVSATAGPRDATT